MAGPWLLVPAAPVAVLLARWTARRGRGLVALGTVEVQLASLVFYVSLNDRLYGGFTPLAVADAPVTGAGSVADYAERVPRLVALWIDRDVGLLRWAPVLALAFLGAWLLWRSRRERLARLAAERRDAEHAAFLALAVCAGQVRGGGVRHAGARRAVVPGHASSPPRCRAPCRSSRGDCGGRRAAGAVAAALTLLASSWLVADGGGWAPPASDAPWGPLVAAFPREPGWAWVAGVALASAGVAGVEWRRRRELRL